MKTIDLNELTARLPELVVAEVLPREHYRSGHLPGARHLPLQSPDEVVGKILPDRQHEVVLYCSGPDCHNSQRAAQRLERLGYDNVRVFTGGKQAWRAAGFDLESSR
jgi:rhodanese-related sulfurtransferase